MSEATVLFRKFVAESGGQRWELDRPNLLTERAYASYLEKREAEYIGRNRAALGPVAYAEAIRQHLANGVNDAYGWCRPAFLDSLASPQNTGKLLWIWFCQCFPEGHAQHVATEDAMLKLYLANKGPLDAMLEEALTDPNRFAGLA